MEEKDKLDQFFKARLSGQDTGASPEGWDLPSERVWEGIEASVRDDKKPAIWWRTSLLVLLALMVLLFAGLWFASQRQVRQLEKTVAEQRQEIKEIIAANRHAKSNSDETYQIAGAVPQRGLTGQKETVPGAGSHEFSPPDGNAPALASGSSAEPPVSIGRQSGGFQRKDTATGIEEQKEEKQPGESENAALTPARVISDPAMIAARWPYLAAGGTPVLTVNPETVVAGGSPKSTSARWLPLELSFSPVLSDRLLTYKGKDIDTRFERTETAGFSWTASALTGVQFSDKFRLMTGLDYFSYSQASTHLMAMRYTLQNATTDMMGNRINTYTTDVPTSFGDASIEIRVADDGAVNNPDLSEGRLFPVEITARTTIRQLGVPVLLEYHSGSGPVQWISRGGLIGNWIIDGDFTLEHAKVVHPGMQTRSFRMTSDKLTRRLNDFTLDLQLSTGAQLNLAERLKLTLLPTFRTNLSPIFNNSKLKTNIYSWSLNAGLAFQL